MSAFTNVRFLFYCEYVHEGHPRAAHGARAAVGVGKIAGGPDV